MAPNLEHPPLEQQVRRLQGQVRRLQRLSLALTALAGGAVLMAGTRPVLERVVARSFVLVDDYGQEVGSLAAGQDGASLVLLHPDTGEVAVRLGVGDALEPAEPLAPGLPETADTPMEARLRRALESQRQRLLERLEPLSGPALASAWEALTPSQRSLLAGTAVEAAVLGRRPARAVPAVAGGGARGGGAFLELRSPDGQVVFYRSAGEEKGVSRR